MHLIFKKLSLAKTWYRIKEESPQFPEKAIKTSLLLPTTYLCEVRFFYILKSKHIVTV